MKQTCVIFITVDRDKSADRITDELLKERLAACVNRVKGVSSSYWWKGKIEKAKENLLIIKTKKSLVKTLTKRVKELHPYTVPEVIALDIKDGNSEYIRWVLEETR